MTRSRIAQFALACILVTSTSSVVWSQSATSLRGTVLDPDGAAVAGAKIILKNRDTGVERPALSGESGDYQFPQAPPGTYTVQVQREGFYTLVVDKLELSVNTPAVLLLELTMGEISQIIHVPSAPPAIEKVDAAMGAVIDRDQILNLPSQDLSVPTLLSLQAGVVYTGIEDPVRKDTRGGAVDGARSDQTNIALDGVIVGDQETGEAFKSVLPVTMESIRELRMVTANGEADLGRSSGGQIAMHTRNGTNDLQGSLYAYNRNTFTTANSFFNNSTIDPLTGKSLERPDLNRNILGVSLGGPAKKNRLFYFLNYENTVTRKQEPQLRIVPSETLRQGILKYVDTAGAIQSLTPGQLKSLDPLGIGPNPAILSLFQQYPVGNAPLLGGDDGRNFAGYRFNAPLREDKPSYIARVDYTSPDQKQYIFIRGSLANWKEDERAPQFPGQAAAQILLTNSKGLAVGHTWVLSPRVVNSFHWGFTRQGLELTGGSTQPGLRLRGLSDILNSDTRNDTRIAPTHELSDDLAWVLGRHTLQFGLTFRNIHNRRSTEANTYPFYRSNDGTMVNSGADLLPPAIDAEYQTPYIEAQMALLGIINQAEITYFVDRDGSILPTPYVPRREFINHEFEWYVKDQWNLAPHVTATAGLRYSYFAPPYEKNGFQVRPDLDVNAWFAGRRDGTLAGIPSSANPLLSFVLAGRANNAPSFFAPDKNNFAPRLSVAWSPSYSGGPWRALFGDSGQSSFRAGVGVFFDRTGGSFPITADLNGAVGLSTFLMTPAATFSYDSSPRFSGLQNLTAIPVPAAPQAGFPSVLNSPGNTGFLVDSRLRTPYSTVFNLSFSRTLPGDITVEAAYVGRVAKDLLTLSDYAAPLINFRDPKSGQSWVDAAGVLADLFGRNTPVEQVPQIPFFENVFPSLATTGLSASQVVYGQVTGPDWTSLLYGLDLSGASIHGPYTFFQEQFAWLPTWTNLGQSSYHSIQLMVRRRFGNGFSADFNYTWAKTTDNGSSAESEGQRADQLPNAFDSRQFISPSSFDVRHQINLNFVADLPFGRSRRFSMPGPVLDRIVSDWRLSGLMRWRTGFPFPNLSGNGFAFPTNFFINGPPTLIPGVAVPRTQVTKDAPGGPNIFSDPAAAYDAFEHTRSGFSGSRNVLYGPGYFVLDAALQRSFAVRDGHLQFRWEVFNVTNHVNFDGRVDPLDPIGIDFDLDAKASFGQLRTLAGSPRSMQFALRYEF